LGHQHLEYGRQNHRGKRYRLDETSLNYNNMPALDGAAGGSSGAISTAGMWISMDVTALVNGNGLVTIAVTTTNSTAIGMSSRESGAHAPQLVITP
jgi:hypothetical protein